MAILNWIFEKNPAEDVTKSLGNMMISGVENEGSRKLYFNMLMNLLHEKKTLILVNGSLSREQHKDLLKFVRPHMVGRCAYDLNLSGSSDSVDILSAFHTSDQKADYVVSLLSMVSEVPDLLKNKAQRFYLYAISTLDAMGKKYTLKDLSMMDVEYVSDLVTASPLPELEKNRRLRFLGDAGMYSSYLDIESCMVMLESSGLLEVLSGELNIKDMLRNGNVVLLNGLISDDFNKKELLFNALFYSMSKFLEKFRSMSRVAFLIKDADFISGDYIKNTLSYNLSYHYATYLFVDDITRYIAKNGNSILDDMKSFLVFNQGSDENAAFWSAFFGSRDVQEKSFSYTKKKSWNPFANMMDNGGVIASPRKYNSATQSFQKVNKPIYRPEVFRELKPNEVMCYLREPLMRRKSRIEE